MTTTPPETVSDPRCLGEIDRRRGLSPREFRDEYYRPGRPVVLQGVIDDWQATREWSFEWFAEHCGDELVPVGRCFGTKEKMPLRTYVERLREFEDTRGAGPDGQPPLYMEGWYYYERRPDLADYYRVPEHFGPDWFFTRRWPFTLEYKPHGLLLGPKGAFTKLHFDLWASHSWNAQIVGRKEWVFVEPRYRGDVYLETRQNGGYVPGTDVDSPDLERFPRLGDVRYTKTVVNPGEVIWFPSMWMHQVVSLDDTISITHNYLSGNIYLRVLSHYFQHRFLGKQGI